MEFSLADLVLTLWLALFFGVFLWFGMGLFSL